MSDPKIEIDADVLIAAAKRHGEDSEPDHEAGDLQDLFRVAHKTLDPSQRSSFAYGLVEIFPDMSGSMEPKDAEFYVDFAEGLGRGTDTELDALRELLQTAMSHMKPEQLTIFVTDGSVQECLENATGLVADPADPIGFYAAVAKDVRPQTPSLR
jgi:hypothetical protein